MEHAETMDVSFYFFGTQKKIMKTFSGNGFMNTYFRLNTMSQFQYLQFQASYWALVLEEDPLQITNCLNECHLSY